MIDERGNQAEFVEDELILVTDDMTALDAFVTRWEGCCWTRLIRWEVTRDMPQMHLVRINTATGDPAQLEADILALDRMRAARTGFPVKPDCA